MLTRFPTLTQDINDLRRKYKKEQDRQITILIQMGSFYEIHKEEYNSVLELSHLGYLLNIHPRQTRIAVKSSEDLHFIRFPCFRFECMKNILLANGYGIIKADRIDNIIRVQTEFFKFQLIQFLPLLPELHNIIRIYKLIRAIESLYMDVQIF